MEKIRRPNGASANLPDPGVLVRHAYHLRVLRLARQPGFQPADVLDILKLIKDDGVVAREGHFIELVRGDAMNRENAPQVLAQ